MDIARLRKLAGIVEDLSPRDFERVMFGNFKNALEPDTDTEYVVFKALHQFIDHATPANKAKASSVLKQLQALKPHYPKDLIPNSKVAYRGTQLRRKDYEKIARKYLNSDQEWIKIDYVYKPQSEIQSWTIDLGIATRFAVDGNTGTGKTYNSYSHPQPAIIQAKVDNTFIMNTELTNALADDIHGLAEHEIIRLSSEPLKTLVLIKRSWLEEFSKEYM